MTQGGKRSQEAFRCLGCLHGNKAITLCPRCECDPQLVSKPPRKKLLQNVRTPCLASHHASVSGPRGGAPALRQPPTGFRFLHSLLLQTPGGRRRLATPCQLLRIAAATAAALRIALSTTGCHHLGMPQRVVGKTSVFDLTFPPT